jgi:hypothetical protein
MRKPHHSLQSAAEPQHRLALQLQNRLGFLRLYGELQPGQEVGEIGAASEDPLGHVGRAFLSAARELVIGTHPPAPSGTSGTGDAAKMLSRSLNGSVIRPAAVSPKITTGFGGGACYYNGRRLVVLRPAGEVAIAVPSAAAVARNNLFILWFPFWE